MFRELRTAKIFSPNLCHTFSEKEQRINLFGFTRQDFTFVVTFCVCPFKMHLRPDSEDRRSCCAQGKKNNILLVNLFFLSKLFLHFQVTQCKSEVKRTPMCRKYKQKWWLSNNLQRNRTRFISSKQVYSPNSRLVIHTVSILEIYTVYLKLSTDVLSSGWIVFEP